jgi:hypothetical protein
MMMKTTLVAISIAVFGTNPCIAQSSAHSDAISWGESVQGVQVSITMTSSVFQAGSHTTVMVVTKNSSTNYIYPTWHFDVLLTNGAGKLYRVRTSKHLFVERRYTVTIKPGEQNHEMIPVTFEENVEPGDYTLKATRSFTVNGKDFKLESNLLKVQIK